MRGADASAVLSNLEEEEAAVLVREGAGVSGGGGGGLAGGCGGGLKGSCLTTTTPAARSDWPVAVDTGTAGKHSDSMSSILMCGVMESGESGPSSLEVIE